MISNIQKEHLDQESPSLIPFDDHPKSHGKPLDTPPPDAVTHLGVPLNESFRKSSDTISDLSLYSTDNSNERQPSRFLSPGRARLLSLSPAPAPSPATWRSKVQTFWTRNKGLALVVLSQLCGGLMSVTARLLEVDDENGDGMHTLQVYCSLGRGEEREIVVTLCCRYCSLV